MIGSIDNKLELFKFLSKKGFFLNIYQQKIEKLCANQKITTHTIVFHKSQGKNYYPLDFPKNPYCSFLLISRDKKFEDLLNIIAAQTDINQKVFILKEDSHEIYEAYKINNVVVKKKLGYVDLISNKLLNEPHRHLFIVISATDGADFLQFLGHLKGKKSNIFKIQQLHSIPCKKR